MRSLLSQLLLLSSLLCAGCHLIFPYGVTSAAGSSDADADAAADLGRADAAPLLDSGGAPDLTPSFGPAKPVTELNSTSSEDDPTLTGDMKEICFERGEDIWCAARADVDAAWGAPAQVSSLDTTDEDATPELAADGLTLFFASRHGYPQAQGGLDVYVVTRATRSDAWSAPVNVSPLNGPGEDLCSAPAANLLAIAFDSDRAGSRDLYLATRKQRSDSWGAPAALTSLNKSTTEDSSPWLNSDATVLYFASDRPGGSGDRDIWVARRASSGASFGPPAPLGSVNTAGVEDDPWVSPDGRTIYFVRNVSGAGAEIFTATR